MANVRQIGLYPPRSDAWIERNGGEESYLHLAATAAATQDPENPTGDVAYVDTQEAEAVVGFAEITGSVTSLTLSVYTLQDGVWYWVEDITPSSVSGSFRFPIQILGKYTSFHVRVKTIAGGGTVAVRVLGVWT